MKRASNDGASASSSRASPRARTSARCPRCTPRPGHPRQQLRGTGGFLEQRGAPKLVGRTDAAEDADVARRLWDVSEDLTGVRFPLGAATAAERVSG